MVSQQGPAVKVSNIVLVKAGRVPSIAEVKCPSCGFANSFKVKSYLGEAGVETTTECGCCGSQIAFKWEKEVRIG